MQPPEEMKPRRRRTNRARVLLGFGGLAVFLFFTSIRGLAGFWTDYLWFDSLSLSSVWASVLWAKIGLGLLFTAIFFVAIWISLFIADRLAPKVRPPGPEDELSRRWQQFTASRSILVRSVISLLFALLVGAGVSSQWQSWLFFTNRVDFGIVDQQFGIDVGFYVFERILRPLWVTTLLVSVAPGTEALVMDALNALLGSGPGLQSHYGWMLLYSLVILLLYDLLFFLIHYAEHKIPVLWAIHKVHHSAEVLTPLTRYREHFLEGPIYAIGAALSFGIAAGVFGWLFSDTIAQATLFNIGFFALLFGFNGSFRHYHVAFHYPRWLSKWLHSPVMHHTHHSYLEHHWDTNLAAVTSIWDRAFGTLYIPKKDEYTPWGLGPTSQGEYRSFWQNVSGPFRDWSAMIKGKSGSSAGLHE